MKGGYLNVMATLPRILNAASAEDYVCGATILKELCDSHGLRPFDRRKGLTAYDRYDIDLAIERKKLSGN